MPSVISDLARTRVRAYAEAHMDSLVTVVRGKRGALDPATGRVQGMAVSAVVYGSTALVDPVPGDEPSAGTAAVQIIAFGAAPTATPTDFATAAEQANADTGAKARVHTVTGQGSISNGAGDIDVRQVQVSIPWAAQPPHRDDLVLVRSGGQDASLVGSVLRVVEVEGGGAFGDARRLSCTLWGRSEYWSGAGSAP
jgi:hypothetical protein